MSAPSAGQGIAATSGAAAREATAKTGRARKSW